MCLFASEKVEGDEVKNNNWSNCFIAVLFLATVAFPALVFAQPTVVVPNDGRFLYDQIDIEVSADILGSEPLVVSIRPGQFLVLSMPEADETRVTRYGFLLHPEVSGKPAFNYDEIKRVADSELSFVLVPHCLEEMDASETKSANSNAAMANNPTSIALKTACSSRRRFGPIEDVVYRLFTNEGKPVMETGIRQGERRTEPVSGISFTVKSYHRKSFVDFERFGPTAMCCAEKQGLEICACKVFIGKDNQCQVGCK